MSEIPDKQKERTKDYLRRIDYISTREVAGQIIIRELLGIEVPVVCDPTALLSRDEWDKYRSDNCCPSEDYVCLLYTSYWRAMSILK